MPAAAAAPFDLLPPLLPGLLTTVEITLLATLVAVPAALVAGTARARGGPLLRRAAAVYVETFRGTSALVQLFWAYFTLPLFGLRVPAEAAAVLVLGLNTGAYGAEIVRGAIAAVPQGQLDAAAALGFPPVARFLRIVLPQALPNAVRPWGNLQIELLKNTSLVALVTLSDLTFGAQTLVAVRLDRQAEILGVVLALYFALSLLITFAMRRLDRFVTRGLDRGTRAA